MERRESHDFISLISCPFSLFFCTAGIFKIVGALKYDSEAPTVKHLFEKNKTAKRRNVTSAYQRNEFKSSIQNLKKI